MVLLRFAVGLALTACVVSGNIFDDYRKERAAKSRERANRPGIDMKQARNFVSKLPMNEESVKSRKSRIEQSLARLDKFMETAPVDNQQGIDTDLFAAADKAMESVPAETNLIEMQANTQFAGAVMGAAANMLFSRTTMCVMCSYILEMCDRQVKASPRWANGGGGFAPGKVDFTAGENQGFYRSYPGGYLELEESVSETVLLQSSLSQQVVAPVGSGSPEPPTASRAAYTGGQPSPFGTTSGQAAMKFRGASSGTPHIDESPNNYVNYQNARPVYGQGTDNGAGAKMEGDQGKKIKIGRFTHRDYDRVDSGAEKSMEYQQMFNDLMNTLDDICFKDLPSEYTQYCDLPFKNGEALVEYYLHDYEDWEICTLIYSCVDGFYDE